MSRLFEPLRIGPVTLRNRTIRAAAFEGMSPGHAPSKALLDYHRAVAKGGVGMTTVAYAAVEKSGLGFPHQLWMREEIVPGLRELTDAVHREGAKVSIQIGHGGNMANRSASGSRPIAPSSRFNPYGPNWPRAMTKGDVARVVGSFGRAATLAREAGFDAVEVHAGHGYLISQFLSPYTNRRRDDYGGDFAGRSRFLREVIGRVRDVVSGRMALLVKMNLRDGFAGGAELPEAIDVARILEREGADALILSGGFVSREPMYIMRGPMPIHVMGRVMPNRLLGLAVGRFGRILVRPWPYEENYFLEGALEVRKAVSLPLVYVGGATSRQGIEGVLGRGFDAVAIGRALICETDFVSRMERDSEAKSECDHCNYCAARIVGRSAACHLRETPPPELAKPLERDKAWAERNA